MRLRKILMVASVTFACVAQAQDLTIHVNKKGTRIQQASAKLRNVFVKALLWC